MLLRLYWIIGSFALAWWCRDSEILTALFILQARIACLGAPPAGHISTTKPRFPPKNRDPAAQAADFSTRGA